MKKGKTSKLDLYNECKCYYGSVDTTELKSIYLVLQTWVTPIVEKENWNTTVGSITRTIKHKIYEFLNREMFRDQFIVDLDLRTSGLKTSKSSFLNLEITFFTKENIEFKSDKLCNELKKITEEIYHNILSNSKYFTIQYSKTRQKVKL
jgi:hypothetical protein